MESVLINRLSALSHPKRMAIFRLLVRRCPDALPAGEIGRVLDLKPSTASVYLAALTQSGLIQQDRRATSLLYRIDLEAARSVISELLLDCFQGRPDLCPSFLPGPESGLPSVPGRKYSVLFTCTGNSARSVFAEAILRHEAGDVFDAFSAGIRPNHAVNPFTIEVLEERGIDTSVPEPKNVAEFHSSDTRQLDFVITVCDLAANEDRAAWKMAPLFAHWGMPDPVEAEGNPAMKRRAFQRTYDALAERIRAFVALPFGCLDRISLQHRMDDIGRISEPI